VLDLYLHYVKLSRHISGAIHVRGDVSISAGQLAVFKATFFILAAVATIWLVTVGSILFALRAFDTDRDRTQTVANGSVYMSALALTLIINVAIIFPGLLLLQPIRLWRVMHRLRGAVTPRQQFRGA
jgi:calcium permeable stress-gated cation channel